MNDKYGRLGRITNVGEYYLFQPIELTDKHITIHERSAPVAYKHTSVEYPLAAEVTEDYLGIGDGGVAALSSSGAPAAAAAAAGVKSNKNVASKVKKAIASLGTEVSGSGSLESSAISGEAVVVGQPEDAESDAGSDVENKATQILITLANKFEICQTLYDKPTKDQVEWYYYCDKILDQISQKEEFQITKEQMLEFIIARLLEEIDKFEDSLVLLNYLYQKNNYSMTTTVSSSAGAGGGGAGGASMSIQPLIPFERMILNYYSQQMIRRVLVGRRAAAASATGSTSSVPQDQGMLLFHEKQKPNYALVILRYETREWTVAEPEDQRDFKLLLDELQTNHIQNISNTEVVGFISLFKKEYLVFKVRVMSNKRDKGARCDQAGKTQTITLINILLSLNAATSGDEYKLTNENTKFQTQRELCVFQEFLFRTFNKNRVNGRKWFLTPSEAILCDIENI